MNEETYIARSIGGKLEKTKISLEWYVFTRNMNKIVNKIQKLYPDIAMILDEFAQPLFFYSENAPREYNFEIQEMAHLYEFEKIKYIRERKFNYHEEKPNNRNI